MQITAIAKSIKISPRKVRLVAPAIRNKKVVDAQRALILLEKRGASYLVKLLNSAIANATNNAKLSIDSLVVKSVEVSDGQALKRYHPSTRGRVHPYKKRSSHVKIILEDSYGTKN